MARVNVRKIAEEEIEMWADENPRRQGESLRAYRSRARAGVTSGIRERYGNPAWFALLLQFLPILIEWLLNRRNTK